MVILPGLDLEHAKAAAQRILTEAIPRIQNQLTNINVSVSIGVAEARRQQTATELINRVDQAMFAAKKKGGNQYVAAQLNSENQ